MIYSIKIKNETYNNNNIVGSAKEKYQINNEFDNIKNNQ